MKRQTWWEAIAVAVVYTLAHGLMLLDRGLFFDDWLAFRQPTALMIRLAQESGSIWPSPAAWLPYSSALAVWGTHAIVFLSFLVVALLALRLLRRVSLFSAEARVAVASLIAVFPVNAARDVTVDWPYAVSLAFFMAGWTLLDSDRLVGWKRWGARVAALLLLFLSFRTASLGLFYVVILLWLIWRSGASWRRPREVLRTLVSWADVIALPIVFLVYRSLAAAPFGPYADYNKLTLPRFLRAAPLVPETLWFSLVGAFARIPTIVWWPVALLAGAAAGAALWKMGPATDAGSTPRGRDAVNWGAVAVVGVGLVVLGVYPYLAVHKIPEFTDFNTRFQLLVPFGAALVVVGLVRAATGGPGLWRILRIGLLAAIIGLCAGTAAGDHLSYQREWYKELGMVEALRAAPQARAGRTFVFDDQALDLNANGRTSRRFYEYAGMFDMAFSTHVRFGLDRTDYALNGTSFYRPRFTQTYKLDGYVAGAPDYTVTVRRGRANLFDARVVARLLWEEWTDSPKLGADAGRTVRLAFQRAR